MAGSGFTDAVLRHTWQSLPEELSSVRFGLWTESVFRWMFIRSAFDLNKQVELQLEWNFFDLLAQEGGRNHLIEFKFFARNQHRHLNKQKGRWKGGPGTANFGEFKDCVKKLANVESAKWRAGPLDEARFDERRLIMVLPDHPDWAGKRSACYADYYLSSRIEEDDDLKSILRRRPSGCEPISCVDDGVDLTLHCIQFDIFPA